MSGRVVLAGVLAGLAVFSWSAVSHMALGLTEKTMKVIPNEGAVLQALQDNVREPGLYFFPGADSGMGGTTLDQAKWNQAYATKPHGILVSTPPGDPLAMGPLMGKQLAIHLVCGLLAAFLLASTTLQGVFARTLFVAELGAFATLAVDAPYWNWYGFPTNYLVTQLVDQIAGWAIAGVVIALVLRRRD